MQKQSPTPEGHPAKTLTVPEAGKTYFNLERDAAYAAARRGELPTIRIGRSLRVPVIALERMLEDAGK
ncbi:helix-turn-helix domain-containing protein [Bradyrhizobium sp. INPA03-11B]|uniref:helix-turn-helix domain-containing protein n=1 Tax=Bradyrhizobium sp. INPA03-11B TaxID=418598 RepID=UPI00338EE1D2